MSDHITLAHIKAATLLLGETKHPQWLIVPHHIFDFLVRELGSMAKMPSPEGTVTYSVKFGSTTIYPEGVLDETDDE